MSRIFFSACAVLALTMILFTNESCNPKQQPAVEVKTAEIKADTSSKEPMLKAKAYVCPMGMQCGQSDSAGKCESCGMELKKDPDFQKK
jgi:hypothetical protein